MAQRRGQQEQESVSQASTQEPFESSQKNVGGASQNPSSSTAITISQAPVAPVPSVVLSKGKGVGGGLGTVPRGGKTYGK